MCSFKQKNEEIILEVDLWVMMGGGGEGLSKKKCFLIFFNSTNSQ